MNKTLVAVVAFVAVASGCYTVNAQLPGTLRNDRPDTESVGRLNIEKTHYFFIDGLIGDPPPDLFAQEIRSQVQSKGADGVANLTFESQFGCFDIIIGTVTLGCIAPRTFKVTGDIVRIRAARLPGRTSKSVDATPAPPSTSPSSSPTAPTAPTPPTPATPATPRETVAQGY